MSEDWDELDEYMAKAMRQPSFRYAYARAKWVSGSWWRRLADRWVPRFADWRFAKTQAAVSAEKAR